MAWLATEELFKLVLILTSTETVLGESAPLLLNVEKGGKNPERNPHCFYSNDYGPTEWI